MAVTPIQLITAACAVINGGQADAALSVFKEAIAPDGTVLYRTAAQGGVQSHQRGDERNHARASGAGRIRRRQRKTRPSRVTASAARRARRRSTRTGALCGMSISAHFWVLRPADDPRIALLVIVDEADVPVDYGGTTAAPFARRNPGGCAYLIWATSPPPRMSARRSPWRTWWECRCGEARKRHRRPGIPRAGRRRGRYRDRPDAQRRRES